MMKTWMSKVHWFYLMKRSEVKDTPGTRKQHTSLNLRRETILSATEEFWRMIHNRTPSRQTSNTAQCFHQALLLGCQTRILPLGFFSWAVPDGHIFDWHSIVLCPLKLLSVGLPLPREILFHRSIFPRDVPWVMHPEISAFSTWGPPHLRDPSVVSRLSCSCGSAPRCAHVFHRLHVPCIRDDTKSIFLCNIMSFLGESLTEEVHSPSWDVSMNSLLFVLYVCSTNVNNLKWDRGSDENNPKQMTRIPGVYVRNSIVASEVSCFRTRHLQKSQDGEVRIMEVRWNVSMHETLVIE